jgi:hypothetical protein
MKLARVPLKILLDEIAALDEIKAELRKWSSLWIEQQDMRENGGGFDPYSAGFYRLRTETYLIKYREQLAKIYDLQGDRGLM